VKLNTATETKTVWRGRKKLPKKEILHGYALTVSLADSCVHIQDFDSGRPWSKVNTLKCTNVESVVKLNTKKVVLLHEHTLRDVYTTFQKLVNEIH